ncbi:MAG: hypothetical protein ACR2QM_19085 [Longimicrobiales bacterium]
MTDPVIGLNAALDGRYRIERELPVFDSGEADGFLRYAPHRG